MAYREWTAASSWWRLRKARGFVFHSPNYVVPPVHGPAVATIHDLSTFLYPNFHPAARVAMLDRELPKTLRRASHFITVSEFVRREVIQTFNLREEQVVSIHNGVEARFKPKEAAQTHRALSSLGLTHGSYLLCVSTVEPRKNIDTLLDAYLGLPARQRQRMLLVIAGSAGWRSDALHRRLRDTAGDGVRYLEYVPDEKLPSLYAGATALALASFYEGYGLPVIEAMACGVPVIVSNAASLPEVAGPDALLVDPRDVDGWRAALERAIDDVSWRQKCIASGLIATQSTTWERCITRTVDVYEQALHA